MTQTVNIVYNSRLVASGVATSGSATIASVSDQSGLYGDYLRASRGFGAHFAGQYLTIHSTSGANATGKTYKSFCVTDAGSTSIVLADKHPFSD